MQNVISLVILNSSASSNVNQGFIRGLMEIDWWTAIVVAIVTSFIFLLFLTLIRPILKISKHILYFEKQNDNGEVKKGYKFKVVNWTMSNLYDFRIELKLVNKYGDGDSTYSVRYTDVPLVKEEMLLMPSMWKGRQYAEYAQIFVTYEDLQNKWDKDSQYLELRVLARHGLSGYAKLKVKHFTDRDVIEKGRFKYGKSLSKK